MVVVTLENVAGVAEYATFASFVHASSLPRIGADSLEAFKEGHFQTKQFVAVPALRTRRMSGIYRKYRGTLGFWQ